MRIGEEAEKGNHSNIGNWKHLKKEKKKKNQKSDVSKPKAYSVYTWHQITYSCQLDLVCALVFSFNYQKPNKTIFNKLLLWMAYFFTLLVNAM